MEADPVTLGGVLGLVGLVLIAINKIIDKLPMMKNGSSHDESRIAMSLENVAKSVEVISGHTTESAGYLKALHEAHTDSFAKRPDGSLKWHNSPDRETDIKETRAIVGDVHDKLKEITGG